MIIFEKDNANFRLKEIDTNDIEDLRVWKNKNKQFFFLKEDITPEQQKNWFENFYSKDSENHMYVVQEKDGDNFLNIGCMGYRIKDGVVDVYNIMRGREFESTNSMSNAFNLMNKHISNTHKEDVTCVVLTDNPARSWYEKTNFEAQGTIDDHVLYKLNKNNLPNLQVETV